jgi:hypothetical protein
MSRDDHGGRVVDAYSEILSWESTEPKPATAAETETLSHGIRADQGSLILNFNYSVALSLRSWLA